MSANVSENEGGSVAIGARADTALDEHAVPSYFPALDGLRFLCCTAVVIAHSFHDTIIIDDQAHPLHAFVANMGATGVDVFFALSGFLITKLLLDEMKDNGRVDVRAFYARRTLRILPVYYTAVFGAFALTALLGERFTRPFAYTLDAKYYTQVLPTFVFFLGNWITTIAIPTPLAILWSVCVEEQFYILFPATFVFSKRRYPALLPIAIGLLLAWATRTWLASIGTPEGQIYRNTLAHGDHLLLGALVAQVLHARPAWMLRAVRAGGVFSQAAVIVASLLFTAVDTALINTPLRWWLYYLVSAIIAASLVAVFALGRGPLLRCFSNKPIRYLGGLTYAGYAFHMYGVAMAWKACSRLGLSPWMEALVRSVIAIPLTFFLAYASKVVVENRFVALKARFKPRRVPRSA